VWAFYVLELKKIMKTNQVKSAEKDFPFQRRKMVEQDLLIPRSG
jgi:hypothetical protein